METTTELQEAQPTKPPADSPAQVETSIADHLFQLPPQEPTDHQFPHPPQEPMDHPSPQPPQELTDHQSPHPPQEPMDQPLLAQLDMDQDMDHLQIPLQLEQLPMVPVGNPTLLHQALDQPQDILLELPTEPLEPLELLEELLTEHLEQLDQLPMVLLESLEELPMELDQAASQAAIPHHMELETLATSLEPLEPQEAVSIHPSHLQD